MTGANARVIGLLLMAATLATACGDSGSEGDPTQDAGGAGDTAGNGGDGGGTGPDGGGVDIDPDVAEEALATPEIDSTRVLSDLTDPELAILCAAQVRWERELERELRAYRCLADATDATFSAGSSAPDPVFTCSRLDDSCMSLIELEIEMEAIGIDISPDGQDEITETDIAVCMSYFGLASQDVCEDPTVSEYKVCLLRNAELERTALSQRELTCAESMPLGTVRPGGMWDCPCGIPDRLGFAPEDDTDWDGVLNSVDACPETERYFRVAESGCSRYEDVDGDAVWDLDDVCPATEEGAEGIDERGCSLAQDLDQDGVPDVSDPCWDTEAGAALVTTGCSAAQDEDADGIPNASDWCPFTAASAEINSSGCAPDQGEPWNEPFLDTLPPDLDVVELSDGESAPIRFHVVPSGVSNATESSFDYAGTMMLDLGSYGFLQLPGSAVAFRDIDPTTGRPRALQGRMPLPMPSVGLLERFRLESVGGCDVSFGVGASEPIARYGLPVVPERHYLAADCDAELFASLGRIRFSLSDEQSLLMLIDPFDPSILFYTDISQLGLIDRVRNAGVAISNQGLIPYTPITTWGVEDYAEGFGGHMYMMAEIPISTPLPSQIVEFTVNGEVVLNLDPEGNGGLDFDNTDLRVGINGDVRQVITLTPGLKLQVDLANASVGVTTGARTSLWASGSVGPSALRLPTLIPARFPAPARAAVYLSNNLDASYVVVETDFQFIGSQINLPLIPDFLDFGISSTLRIDKEGIAFEGTVSGAIHEWLRVRGSAQISGFIGWSLRDFRVEIRGDIVFRDDTSVSELYFGDDDIRINGRSYLPF